jgi:hypothetical protein
MRGVLIVACTLAALTMAPTAHAVVRIGSDLATPPANTIVAMDPMGLTAAQAGAVAPFSGVITRWRVRVGAVTTPVRLRILRRGTPGTEVEHSDPNPTPPRENSTTVYETDIRVAAGDQIALDCCAGAAGGTFFVADAGTTDIWSPPIEDGAELSLPTQPVPQVGVALNADLEPDRDGDGLGDDTQDDNDDNDDFLDAADVCPTVAGPAPNGCPAPPATPPPPRVNTPAIVRFRTPLVGTEVGPSQLIELDVFDDFGTPTVTVFDDDGTVCTLRAAPYSCTWTPTGADVGRATLLASAVDADNRSSLAGVRVRVARFEAALTRRVKGRRVSGKLRLPAAVEPELGCDGEVTVRRGKVRRRVDLKPNCTYKTRLPQGKGRVRVKFGGNQVVAPT